MIFISQCFGRFVIAFFTRVVPVMGPVDDPSSLHGHANRLNCSDGAENDPISLPRSGFAPQR